MVKVTIEHEDGVRIIEGECTMVYMQGPEGEDKEKTQIALVGRHEDPDSLLIKIARAVGVLVKEFHDNPFKRFLAGHVASKALMDTVSNDDIEVSEMCKKMERIQ